MTSAPITFPKAFAPAVATESPLSEAHLGALEEANRRAGKVRRAAGVATADAWIAAVFAGVTLLSAVFSPVSAVLGAALAGVAWNAFRGAKRLRSFDGSGARLLALNQVALAVILISYAAWSLWAARHGSGDFAAAIANEPALAGTLGNLQQLYWVISVGIYGGLIVGTIFAQGLAALYYASRKKLIDAYLSQTPAWIVELQRRQQPR